MKIALFIDENIIREELDLKYIKSQLPPIYEVYFVKEGATKGWSDRNLILYFSQRLKDYKNKGLDVKGFFITLDFRMFRDSWMDCLTDHDVNGLRLIVPKLSKGNFKRKKNHYEDMSVHPAVRQELSENIVNEVKREV